MPGGSQTKTEFIDSGALLPLESNLIHLWRYNSDYVDARGGITLVPEVGTPPFVTGKYGNAVEIEQGVSDKLVATDTIDQPTGSFSVAGWAYRVTATGSPCSYNFLGPIRSSPFAWQWALNMHTAFGIRFDVYGSSGFFRADGPAHLLEDTWAFYCGVWDDDTPAMTLYSGVSGGALQSLAGTDNGYTGPRRNTGNQVRGPYFTVGKANIDHVKVWGIALTSTQVAALLAQGLAKE